MLRDRFFFYSESIFALINTLIKNLPSTSTLMTLPAISQGIAQENMQIERLIFLFKQGKADRSVDFYS